MIRPYLYIAIIAAIVAVAGWGWQQSRTANTLRQQLTLSAENADLLTAQLASASQTISTQQLSMGMMAELQRAHAASARQLAQVQQYITTRFDQRRQTLDTLSHDNPTAKTWGDTAIPDPIASVLIFHADSAAAPGAPADHQPLPADHPLPAADGQPIDQPPAGGQPYPPPAGAGTVRSSSAEPDPLPAAGQQP